MQHRKQSTLHSLQASTFVVWLAVCAVIAYIPSLSRFSGVSAAVAVLCISDDHCDGHTHTLDDVHNHHLHDHDFDVSIHSLHQEHCSDQHNITNASISIDTDMHPQGCMSDGCFCHRHVPIPSPFEGSAVHTAQTVKADLHTAITFHAWLEILRWPSDNQEPRVTLCYPLCQLESALPIKQDAGFAARLLL